MSDQVLGFLGAIAFFAFLIISVRGLAALFEDMFGEWGARLKWKRERRPLSVRDKAIEAIVADMANNPTNWLSSVDETSRGWNKQERIKREDKRITLSGYTGDNLQTLSIEIEGLGAFGPKQIRPSLAKALKEICLAHKDYLALGVVLSPDSFKLIER